MEIHRIFRYGAALLSAAALLLTACGSDPQNRTLEEAYQVNIPGQDTVVQENHTPEYDTEFYLGETVFVGDSRTNGMIGYGYLPPEQVYAIDGCSQKSIQDREFVDLGDGKLYTVEEAVAIRQPERIMILLGINGLTTMGEEEFMEEYRALTESLHAASPESTIILQSILPTAWWKYQEIPAFDNDNIDYYNELLCDYAQEAGYFYLNSAEIMKDSRNSLRAEYDAGDGLHFNSTAYEALMEYYTTHMVLAKAPASEDDVIIGSQQISGPGEDAPESSWGSSWGWGGDEDNASNASSSEEGSSWNSNQQEDSSDSWNNDNTDRNDSQNQEETTSDPADSGEESSSHKPETASPEDTLFGSGSDSQSSSDEEETPRVIRPRSQQEE